MNLMVNFIRSHKTEILLFALSLFIHVIVFAVAVHVQNGSVLATVRVDDGYFDLAQNVLAGNGFSWSTSPPYAPNPMRTPGYAYVLAGLIATLEITGAAVLQLIVASAIPIFGMYIAQAITESRRIGILTGVILAVDPTLALLSFEFYTDTLFLLLFLPWILLTFHYFEQKKLATLTMSAILLGCAILVRPVAQYIPFIIVLFILWSFGRNNWRRATLHSGVYLLVTIAILSPWIVRNVHEFGVPGLSAQTPFVLYTNLAPAVLSVAHKSDFQYERQNFMTEAESKGDAITLANGSSYTARALEVVRANPLATAYVAVKSLFTFFTNDGFYTLIVRTGGTPANFLPLLIAMRLVWIAITCAACIGALLHLFRKRSPRTILIVFLVVYFALTSTIAAWGTNPRYRLPVDPIIIAFAAVGVLYIREHSKHVLPRLFLKNHSG